MNINYLKPLSLLIGIIILCTACTDSEHDKTEANNNPEIGVPALDSTNRKIPGNNLTVNDQNYDLRELKMIDEKTGWALTKSGVWRTNDGGATWLDVGPNEIGSEIYAQTHTDSIEVFFLNGQEGWIAYVDSKVTYIYHTKDGGLNWKKTGFSNDDGVSFAMYHAYITFLDAQHGWLLGETGPAMGSNDKYIYKTVDGGDNWILVNAGYDNDSKQEMVSLPRHGYPNGFTFINSTTGWVTYDGRLASAIPLYRTDDGGATWNLQEVEEPIEYAPENEYYSTAYPPVFSKTNPQEGTLLVEYRGLNKSVYLPYITNDGGDSWTPTVEIITKEGPAYTGKSVYFIGHHGWLLDQKQNKLYVSKNGGADWEELGTNLPIPEVIQIGFSDSNHGWAVINEDKMHNQLWMTQDGGERWNAVMHHLSDSNESDTATESKPFQGEAQLYTTEDWNSFAPTDESMPIQYSIELPPDWKLKNQIIYDQTNLKAGEIMPPILLKPDQSLLEGWAGGIELEFVSREDFATENYSGQKLVQKVYTEDGECLVETYYLQNGDKVFQLYFFERDDGVSLDQIVETIQFQ